MTDFLGEMLEDVKKNFHALRSHADLRQALVDQAVNILFGDVSRADLEKQLKEFKQVSLD